MYREKKNSICLRKREIGMFSLSLSIFFITIMLIAVGVRIEIEILNELTLTMNEPSSLFSFFFEEKD